MDRPGGMMIVVNIPGVVVMLPVIIQVAIVEYWVLCLIFSWSNVDGRVARFLGVVNSKWLVSRILIVIDTKSNIELIGELCVVFCFYLSFVNFWLKIDPVKCGCCWRF